EGPGREIPVAEDSALPAIDREIAVRCRRPVELALPTVAEQVERIAPPGIVGRIILAQGPVRETGQIGDRSAGPHEVIIVDAAYEPERMADLMNRDAHEIDVVRGDAVARIEVEIVRIVRIETYRAVHGRRIDRVA